ncbi:MAG: penicillin acylase family protein [Gemmatimonadaceae bacterium]
MTPTRHLLAPVIAAALLSALVLISIRPTGPLPPVGPLLDPLHGAWAVARDAELPLNARAPIPGLSAETRVVYDRRGVPHIFASTEEDVYRALGYVVARDRLFQLDLQTRAAAGTLTELVGARALGLDRDTRRFGLPRSAERKLAALDTSSAAAHALRAYAEGINARISSLRPYEVPLEYLLLGARPAPWASINSLHLLNRMALTLAVQDGERRRAAVDRLVGRRATDALFPRDNPIQEPMQPNGQRRITVAELKPLPPPGAPDSSHGASSAVASREDERVRDGDGVGDGDVIGSNNWAVSPSRTRSGHAILAGDPHLELTLPSLWYEAHLVVPGRLDVYGVTIPGSPVIIIGFNRDVAWTFTNTGADVMDFYRESVDDNAAPRQYVVDGTPRPIETRLEHYRDRRGRVIAVDTVRFTHRGPLHRSGGQWISMRWTALEPSSETDALITASHAGSARDWLDAMSRFEVPAQNMLVADRAGTIAIRANGRVPLRPPGADPTRTQDGTTSAADWRGSVPLSRIPQSVNPAQGFLVSANQQPAAPRRTADYLGANWPPPWRAIRINDLMRADSAVTLESVQQQQTDVRSPRAALFAPYLVAAARRVGGCAGAQAATELCAAADHLAAWDYGYARADTHGAVFELAMREVEDRVWMRLVVPSTSKGGERPRRVDTPAASTLAQLLEDPTSLWWDDPHTPQRETRDSVLAGALARGWREAVARWGTPGGPGWRWDHVHAANIHHLLRIPALSRLHLPPSGGPATISPSSGDGRHGSSWRMAVELGPQIAARGIYPGGQSGNPASSRYADRLPRWLAGELDTLWVPADAGALSAAASRSVLVLTPR